MKKLIIILIVTFIAPLTVFAQGQSNQETLSGLSQGYNPDYNVLPIILTLIMLYLIIYLLYDNKTINRRTYKQIWSLVLVGSFLFVGIGGIVLSLLADFNLLFWHVEAGIILSITTIFHIHIHWKRFKEIINANVK